MQALDSLRDLPVERPALPGEDVRVDRLAGERVAKGKAVLGLLDHKLGSDCLLDRGEQGRLLALGEGLEQGEIELLARHGGETEQILRLRTELVHPQLHSILNGARNVQL